MRYPPQPREATTEGQLRGEIHAEEISGLPSGLEINVGGTDNGNGRIDGGVWFDHDLVRDGQPILVDIKDWVNFPEFIAADKAINTARSQVQVATEAGNISVEWWVTTQDTAEWIRDRFRRNGINITVRVVP